MPEGGFEGAILEGHMEKIFRTFSMMKVLRTFSGPVLNDDVIEPLITIDINKVHRYTDAYYIDTYICLYIAI